eukprot:11369717-Heterocapsa_arctica.AAC.1
MHIIKDAKAEWCKEKVSKLRGLEVEEHWKQVMEPDIDGTGLAHFITETKDRTEWGGAEQIC